MQEGWRGGGEACGEAGQEGRRRGERVAEDEAGREGREGSLGRNSKLSH